MQSLFMIALISIEWVYIGYSMSFGPDIGGFIGSLEWFALKGVTSAPSPDYASTIPQTVFMIYQCMFAVITPALITGAFAERVRFGPFIVFSVLWSIFVYNPVCHWIWGWADRGFRAAALPRCMGRNPAARQWWLARCHGSYGFCRRACGASHLRCCCTGWSHCHRTQKRVW